MNSKKTHYCAFCQRDDSVLCSLGGKMAHICAFLSLLLVGSGAIAQSCPPDQNWNGHPLFGATQSSPDLFTETIRREATSLRFGDLNGDGLEDLILGVSITDSYVAVLLSRGDGTFERRIIISAGDEDELETCDAWAVDLDGDGDLDIATANARADDCTMLFNDGQANFTRGPRYPLGDEPRSLVAGDLDGDGDQDLAYLNVISQDVSILLNRGDGTFEPEVRVPVGGTTARGLGNRTFPYPGPFLAIADLDGDRDMDLVVPGRREAKILDNDGSGRFTPRGDNPRTSFLLVYDIELRDLNADGDPDIAAALYGFESRLGVWLNNGDGTFGEFQFYDAAVVGDSAFHFSTSLGLGDIDNDGDLDATIGNEFHGLYALLRNNGDGMFAPFESYLVNEGPWLVDIQDMNADGWADVVSVPSDRNAKSNVVVNLNDGAGVPHGPRNSETGKPEDSVYGSIDHADLDGDGDLDVVLGNRGGSTLVNLRAMENDGTGTMIETWEALVGKERISQPEDIRLAHMNRDGWLDLVFSLDEQRSVLDDPGSIWVAFGLPGLQFDDPVRYGFEDSSPSGIEIADIDGDGDNDVLAHLQGLFFPDDPQPVDRRMAVLLNDGEGVLTIHQELVMDAPPPFRGTPFGNPAVADFDGDGDLDVLGVSGTDEGGVLVVMLNDGTGTLTIDHRIVTTALGYSVAAGDFDGDGDPDAAINHWFVKDEIPNLTIYENDGTAHFSVTQTITAVEERVTSTLHVLDIDADQDLDLICPAGLSGVMVYLNDGLGDFSNNAWYASNAPAIDLALGDFDLDGDIDIISPRISSAGSDPAPIVMLENVMCRCAADLDRDGVLSADDFFLFLDRYSQGNLSFCDVDRDGDCDAEDFFAYLDLFAAGCG